MSDYKAFLFELAQKRYDSEHELWNRSNTLISIYIGGLAVFLGFLIDFELTPASSTTLEYTSYGLLIAAVLCVLFILYQVFRFISGHRYEYIPGPDSMTKYVKELEEYYAGADMADKSAAIRDDMINSVIDKYNSAVSHNFNENVDRLGRLVVIGRTIVVVFCLALALFVLKNLPKIIG